MDGIEHAIALFRQGSGREAIALCDRRLTVAPNDVDTLSLLAEILMAGGENARAALVLDRIIELRPLNATARRRLGGALLALGRDDEAAQTLRAAIQVEPDNGRAHNNLGQALLRLNRIPEAIASFQAALRLDAGHAAAKNNLGLAYAASGQLDEALAAYDGALATASGLVEAWLGRGMVLARQNHLELALQSFTRALDLKPGDPVTLTHQAVVLLSMERAAESLVAADAAVRIDALLPPAHNARAGALRRLGRRAEAARALERALALDPRYVDAWGNLGTVLHEMGLSDEALAACRRALDLDPAGIQSRTRMLARLIPSVPGCEEEVTHARHEFERQLAGLQTWLDGRRLSETEALNAAQQQLFYLSYQEQSNRSLLQAYRSACAARLERFDAWRERPSRIAAERAGRRFRLGFVSAHVYDHSVFHAILRGWLQCMSRAHFEISLFCIGIRRDGWTQSALASVDHVETDARGIGEWARTIRDRQMDAIIYPEIGMNEPTLALSSLRLAARQFVAWGHPETSGLSTLDGYLSAELFEPTDAQDHYTEPLVRLPNLGVHCERYGIETTNIDLERLGLSREGPIFVCPGAPFKYHPKDDWILVEIARRLQRCTFLFFEHEIPELSRKLEARMAAAFTSAGLDPGHHLRKIARQPRSAFFAILRRADVYLDTVGFSGFNTLMQAMECHLPCVTYEGRFLRSRFGSGILRRLGIPQCIAHDARQYIELAVSLADNTGYRAGIRAAIQSAEERLYGDSSAVDALSAHLLGSLDS